MSSVLQCRVAGDVVNFFKTVFLSGEYAVPAELVQFIIDNVINKHYRSKNATRLSKTFRKECTESLNKNFPVLSVVPLDDAVDGFWTPKYVLGAAFTLIENQHMLTNSSSYKFYSHETFIDQYGDNLAFGGVEEKDLPLLVSFCNIAIAFFRTVDNPNLKKEMLMFIAGSLSVGKTTTYIMGSGQNKHVDRREVIYHIESGIPMKPWSDVKIESFLNSKRQHFDDESFLCGKKQKIDLPLLTDPFPNLPIQQVPASVLVCPVSPPPSLPYRALPLNCEAERLVVEAESMTAKCKACDRLPACISVADDPPAAPSGDADLTTTESPPRTPDGATFSAYAMDEDTNSLSSHGSAFSFPTPDTVPEWEDMPLLGEEFDDISSLEPLGTL